MFCRKCNIGSNNSVLRRMSYKLLPKFGLNLPARPKKNKAIIKEIQTKIHFFNIFLKNIFFYHSDKKKKWLKKQKKRKTLIHKQ
jgi:hypothetical protein